MLRFRLLTGGVPFIGVAVLTEEFPIEPVLLPLLQ